MNEIRQPTLWQRWLRQPQKLWLRRALFQLHLWSGISVGLYILMISLTGSVLVYRNELYRAATPPQIRLQASGPLLTDAQLSEAAEHAWTGYRVTKIVRLVQNDLGVDVWLSRGDTVKKRIFNPWTGQDLRDTVPAGIRLVSGLMDLHDNLFGGTTGREVNGAGAILVIVVALTGLVVWWPGLKTWRRSLTLHSGVGWKRWIWHLHSMVGFWGLAFTLIFALSGIYLTFPDKVQDFADWLEPITSANARGRIGDQVIYWLAYLHFGRIQGIGIPCKGPGVCDQTTKAVWALFGLAPAVLFVSGAIMWWNRVVRPGAAKARRKTEADAIAAR